MTLLTDIQDENRLPNGNRFSFWDDTTTYHQTYHLAKQHPEADDRNPGTEDRPWKTIQRAADNLQSGEEVVVHEGIYRETVVPKHSGKGSSAMIRYRGAVNENVIIKGSVRWVPEITGRVTKETWGNLWSAPLPLDDFRGINPFQAVNLSRSDWFPWQERPMEEIHRAQHRQGMIFQDGERLQQVSDRRDLKQNPGTFWVDNQGLEVWVRLFEDAEPVDVQLEVTNRFQCFVPETSLGWIVVQGFTMEHAANGVPMPAFGTLSSAGGHHWIVQQNHIRDANAVGLDFTHSYRLGEELDEEKVGRHIVRRNRIERCGITGICGVRGLTHSLVEENHITEIGGMNLEHCYESAGIKFHFAEEALIRNNRIQHMRHASGIWMDYYNRNCRISSNEIEDVETVLAGIYVEANIVGEELNWVDGNQVSHIRDNPPNDPPKDGIPGGMGISVDVSENILVLSNTIQDCTYFGIACHRAQPEREIHDDGDVKRVSNNTGHQVYGNRMHQTKGLALEAEKGLKTDVPEADITWL